MTGRRRPPSASWILLAAAFLTSLVIGAGSATAGTLPPPGQTVVQARITYHASLDGSIEDVRLLIYRDGVRTIDRAPVQLCAGCEGVPFPPEEPNHAVAVLQLDGTPEPEVVFSLYSGGAHCCIYAEIFRWDPSLGRYLLTTHDFRDSGYRRKDLRHNGRPLFLSADDRFAYRFSCFACSLFPPRIWEYRRGRMIDVTRSFPNQVRKDLARVNRYYRERKGRGDIRPILAALVADKCLLGRCASGFRLVRGAERAGYVRLFNSELEYGPHGREFLPVLHRFLGRLGYLSG